MPVTSDPATTVALVFLILLLLTLARLHVTKARRREGQRRLAEATGHPSVYRRTPVLREAPDIERIP